MVIYSRINYFIKLMSFFKLIFFWPHHMTWGILVPGLGIKPIPPALEVWSLNHWTAREVPNMFFKLFNFSWWIHVYVWLSPFTVHLKLSQIVNQLIPQYKKFKKNFTISPFKMSFLLQVLQVYCIREVGCVCVCVNFTISPFKMSGVCVCVCELYHFSF